MIVFIVTTLIMLLVSLAKDFTYSTNAMDSARNGIDNDILRELLQRIDTIQSHLDRTDRNNNIRFDQLQSHMDQMDRNINIRFDKLEGNDLNVYDNIKNLSIVMETIAEQQMVITAEIFTVSQTLPFCCCQYQNTTEAPKVETTTLKIETTTSKPVKVETTTLKIETTTPKPVKSFPTNCAAVMGESDPDGVYQINVTDSNIGPFDVYCMKKVAKSLEEDIIDGTWLIIQRRQDSSIDFYRGWNMYQRGFGALNGNYWIGLDKLYALTKSAKQELWIQLEDHKGDTRWAKYSNFAIGKDYEKYALKTLGQYNGTAGDSLKNHKGLKWTTFDQDNDEYPYGNCAQEFNGAWWYGYCLDSDLNGKYGSNKHQEGIIWSAWHGWYYSLKYAHMAIRPKQ